MSGAAEMLRDHDLLRRSSEGDRPAFCVFMDRHAASVYRFLRSLDATSEDAEDALQECFVSAWRSAAQFKGNGSARAWLFSIARNALNRQHRRKVGEPDVLEPLDRLGAYAGWGYSSDFAHAFDSRSELDWAMSKLPEEEREVVLLRDVEGFSGHEAADALGLSLAAMKSRLHRGRLKLMGLLKDSESDHA